jgi:hypothetical protein
MPLWTLERWQARCTILGAGSRSADSLSPHVPRANESASHCGKARLQALFKSVSYEKSGGHWAARAPDTATVWRCSQLPSLHVLLT